MKYLKNTDLAEMYKVSEDTITNWVKSAKQNKIDLQVKDEGKRTYILNSDYNHFILKELSQKARKYKNKKALKVISPSERFYNTFEEKQIIDLIVNLEANREIDLKYVYFNEGATHWDKYVEDSLKKPGHNVPKNTVELLKNSQDYLFHILNRYKHINVVDIGVGNGMTVRGLLEFFHDKKVLNKYVGIDYSNDVIQKAKSNLNDWFGDSFPMEFHTRDITYEGLKDLLFINSQAGRYEEDLSANLILFIGSTIENQRLHNQALTIIKNSMGPNDIFILGQTLDSESTVKYSLSLSETMKVNKVGNEAFFLMLDLLNIDDSMYEVEGFYDSKTHSRVIQAKLKHDLNIKFETKNIMKTVKLSKKDHIVLYRHKHHKLTDVINNLAKIGFEILSTMTSLDYGNINVVSRLERN
jgi:uncharacterized SAM-dependent methyltransferase